jgi:ribosomal protein S18 acetylase RimI-like enzyme
MIVRQATLAELNRCLQLDHACQTDHVWQLKMHESESELEVCFHTVRLPRQMRADYPRSLDQVIEHWHDQAGFLVAEVDGEVRAYVDLIPQSWQLMGWMANVAVEPSYRRRGLATALVRQVGRWARDQGLRSLLAEATTKNYPAICFYQKLGFTFCGFNDHYYPNQDIALFFVLTLTR